ncbi:tRNA (adenosine(37)-N6)-dimethylallyltransferase MiaA [candidate division KSB1 bacterium]|nr:tRNA (adenosine(37)-N6)-dimethylallyltransferase MiaA [candidate division KSB1 bacterium]NIR69901.1 tRNA (adenosine(37)-N6)-dimethylallyltransferase MiaA [candidate division KSB1 bacterium]NIS23003.1 tRNA (adenosine(37)-N6)-dimethylallyltransferase MiaA [candidate division KSB1 bacterium]NIT69861.1 tRNA (adenosine(37)-N6)-dimethylallyltransferase MiaA [candidate division KSB1 bacterium]NIU23510.1 tRNA (adenosine(37)-N6)-dimethylallyltransferase MiaA [candidate division KSB1 bacterium]
MKQKVLFIVGPTGVGKTEVSLEVARHIDAEIVSADSRQIYKYMDIGTAKPSREQLAQVPHHFIDIRSPDEPYSAGQYGQEARQRIREIFARRKQPIVVGGSGLYIRALIDGFFSPRISDQEVKSALKMRLRNEGLEAMYAELTSVDPDTADRLKPTDTQRILRGLEVFKITGEPLSQHQNKKPAPANFDPNMIGLTMDRQRLYRKIELRVDRMLAEGFVEEVKGLLKRGYGLHLNALQTVGYKQVIAFVENRISYEEMIKLMKQKTRNYAKRQLTWFRNDERIKWLDLSAYSDVSQVADHIYQTFETAS